MHEFFKYFLSTLLVHMYGIYTKMSCAHDTLSFKKTEQEGGERFVNVHSIHFHGQLIAFYKKLGHNTSTLYLRLLTSSFSMELCTLYF
jgi:hypothetical protein